MKKDLVYVIVGPTASGKSSLALELAKKINGEIISSDSMQIYKKLDIGTAKATLEEQKQIRHHLIDIKEVYEEYSACEFVENANIEIEKILKSKKVPIVVGGTGLYVNSLVNELEFNKEETDELNKKLKDIENKVGQDMLWNYLYEIDKDAANSIDKTTYQG